MRVELSTFSEAVCEVARENSSDAVFRLDTGRNTIEYGLRGRDAELIKVVHVNELALANFDIVKTLTDNLRSEVVSYIERHQAENR